MSDVKSSALFVYIPVVHAGILEYVRSNPDTVVVLLDNVKAQSVNKFLERDIRALPAAEIQSALNIHGVDAVLIADQTNVADVLSEFQTVYIPKDEVIRDFLAQFAPAVESETISLFVRWTKMISTQEYEIPVGRIVTLDVLLKRHMETLESVATTSPDWWRQIAAALMSDGELLVVAYNAHYPSQHALSINGDPRSNLDAGQGPGVYTSIHAEASVIAQAAKQGIATNGLDMIVTTFPCPTCARSLVEAGIARVYYRQGYSLLDAEEILSQAGIEIVLIQ